MANNEKTTQIDNQQHVEANEVSDAELSMYRSLIKGSFSDKDLEATMQYAASASKEKFRQMLAEAPSIVLKEKLWGSEVQLYDRKYPGFKQELEKKLAAEPSVDRRILMAEAIWKIEYQKMENLMPQNLKSDLKKYYGKYDRIRAKTKHGIASSNNPIPNYEEVVQRMKTGIERRMILEYTIAASAFEKDSRDLFIEHIKQFSKPEEIITEYNSLIEKHIPNQERFDEKRSKLMKDNPAAHDFFLRLYNKDTQEGLYSKRDTVLDNAVKHINSAIAELSQLTIDKTLLDLTKYSTIEELIQQIQELKVQQKQKIPTTKTKDIKITQEEITKIEAQVDQDLAKGNSEYQRLTLQEAILRDRAKASRIEEKQSTATNREKRLKQIKQIEQQMVQNAAIKTTNSNEEKEKQHEKFSKQDTIDGLVNIGLNANTGMKTKDRDEVIHMGRIMRDTSSSREKDGTTIMNVITGRGDAANDSAMLSAADDINNQVATLRQDAIQKEIEKTGKVLNPFKKKAETANARKYRIDSVLDNIDTYAA